MAAAIVKFNDWTFKVNKALTSQTYRNISAGGADSCCCDDCRNFVACRDTVFPDEIRELFLKLGIDYRKEVEIVVWETRPDGSRHIGGWFHFKGAILAGRDCRVLLRNGAIPWI